MSTDTVVEEEAEQDQQVDASFEILEKQEASDHTYVRGPVLVPEKVDKQGDVISADEIEITAHEWMENSQRGGIMHKTLLAKRHVVLVESYLARTQETINGRRILKGSWVTAWKVYEPKLRKAISDGKIAGFSIGGKGDGEAIEESDD